jgi:Flp pilus assembly protein TadD
MVLKLARPYTLAGDGTDLYRNFVFPTTGLTTKRFVRAVELRSGNARVMHHANLFLDRTGAARRRAAKAGGNGYDAMDPGDDVVRPEGSDLNWRPGRDGLISSDDSPWTLPADADIVLQTHLRRQGKPEALQPEIGLYFTDKRPTALVARLTLRASTLDIPAGDADYVAEAQYALPVAAEALGVFAHAHYLGKEVHGWADLPGGAGRVELLKITRWNFNMQDSYTYAKPIPLPQGAVVHMRWVYDNSANNPVNPTMPPRRVFGGENSTDEMGELWVQLRMKDKADLDAFNAGYAKDWALPDAVQSLTAKLARTPGDATLHVDLAKLYLSAGLAGDANKELEAALRIDPSCAGAHYVLARMAASRQDFAGSVESLRKCVAVDPDNFRARGDLALTLAIVGKRAEAVAEFKEALKLNPRDVLTHVNLGRVYALMGDAAGARTEVEAGLKLDPDDAMARGVMRELK